MIFNLEEAEKNWRFFEINNVFIENNATYSHIYDLFYDIGIRSAFNEIRKLRSALKEEHFNREWESGKYRDKETAREVSEMNLRQKGLI